MKAYVGIDLGTSATKVLVLRQDGSVAAKARAGYEVRHPRVGWSEQAPLEWWRAVTNATRRALAEAGRLEIAGVALSGQLNGLVLLDAAREPLGDAIIWLDLRSTAEAAWLDEALGAVLRAATLNPANPIYVGAKLLWLRRHEPERLNAARHLLLAKDYVNFRLAGELATDRSDASCTLLYDLRTDGWIPAMLEATGVGSRLLPALHASTAVIGAVTPDAAEATGLPVGTPVMAGAGDVTALSVGSGAVEDGVCSVTLGTAGHVVAASTHLTDGGYDKIWQMRHALDDRYLRLGLVMSGGLSLSWFEREFGGVDGAHGTDGFEELLVSAAASPAGARGAFFLPFLEGAATPYQAPDLKAAYLGVTSAHTRGDLARATLEGVAYNVRECVDLLERLGTSVREIRLSEGGSRSDLWCRIIADVLGKPVTTLQEMDASALGAAMIAMAGARTAETGSPTADLRDVVRMVVRSQADRGFEPDRDRTPSYEEGYRRYRQAAEHVLAWTRGG